MRRGARVADAREAASVLLPGIRVLAWVTGWLERGLREVGEGLGSILLEVA